MIHTYKLSTSSIIAICVAFFLIVIVSMMCSIRSTQELIGESFSGKISKYEPGGKGTMSVWIGDNTRRYSISGFARYRDTIKVGDSLHKKANSPEIYYYKQNDGIYYLHDVFIIY
jgi:hypothetical protein